MNSAVRLSNSKVLVSELDATNSTLTLTSQYVGDSMVTVFMLDDPTIKDVFQVSVSSIMKPISPISLHLGDKMQFENAAGSTKTLSGLWSSEAPGIASVDSTGHVETRGVGTTNIKYEADNQLLKARVVVQKVSRIEPQEYLTISNYERSKHFSSEYEIPLDLYTESNEKLPEIKADESHLI
jgi:hypothetical protein